MSMLKPDGADRRCFEDSKFWYISWFHVERDLMHSILSLRSLSHEPLKVHLASEDVLLKGKLNSHLVLLSWKIPQQQISFAYFNGLTHEQTTCRELLCNSSGWRCIWDGTIWSYLLGIQPSVSDLPVLLHPDQRFLALSHSTAEHRALYDDESA